MAEDQGVNGDIWTDQATRFLEKLGWIKIADSNIDVPGSNGLKHGIDSIFQFSDGFKPDKGQGVFIEAKRYKTTSFSASKLADWIKVIDKKIRSLDNSSEFYDKYPTMSSLNIYNGLLVIWFPDTENYPAYREKFREALLNVKTPRSRGVGKINRLFVLENDNILRLISLMDAVEEWNRSYLSPKIDTSLKFHYPSSQQFGYPIQEIKTLNLEYMFSKFILARATMEVKEKFTTADVIFYFGEQNMHSFFRLKEALLSFDMLSSENSLFIYLYQKDDEFRKIKPDVIKLFQQDKGPQDVNIKSMIIHRELPPWINDD